MTTSAEIRLTGEPLGEGRERICYQHPAFPDRVIKVPNKGVSEQTRREMRFYRDLELRGLSGLNQIPAYFGTASTNLGEGVVMEKICDWDGQVSESMWSYLDRGCRLAEFEPYLHDLKQFLFGYHLVFNHDLVPSNLFFRKLSATEAQLVAIDGLGDVVKITILNRFDTLLRAKLERRWQRFIRRLYRKWQHAPERKDDVMEAEYRRSINQDDLVDSIERYLLPQ